MVQDEARRDTVSALFARTVARRGGDVALIDGAETLDWRTLDRRARGFAGQLQSLGIGVGDRVALWLPNGIDYVVAILAAARCGAVAVHVNTRFGAAEVGDLLSRTRAALLVTGTGFDAADFLDTLAAVARERLSSLRAVVARGAPVAPHGLQLVPPVFEGESEDLADVDGDCTIYTTGGTTARPKLVVHRQHSIADHAVAVASATGLDRPGATLLAAVPFCGTFGNVALMAAIAGGARIVCMAKFDGEEARALIRSEAITHLVGDDRMMARLAEAALSRGERYDSVRFFGVAAFGPDAGEALARGGEAGLRPQAIYGSSEAQALFAIGDPSGGGWGAVRPLDPAGGFALGGDADELLLQGPSLFDRYLDDEEATRAARVSGLFRSGDRATASDGGFVFEGRIGDVLRLGGFLVSPLEIEAFLQAQPGVALAQVVSVEGPRGTAAFAFVVPDPGVVLDEAGLIARCRAMLARYKVPLRIVEVAAFPTSAGPNGPKISRAELRRLAADTIAASAPAKIPERM